MKILDRQSFLAMPRGTLFCKISISGLENVRIKLDTFGEDFVYRDPIEIDARGSDELMTMFFETCEYRTREDLPLDWHPDMMRDGLFERDQLFAVLNRDEVTSLISMLTNARDASI